MQVFKTRIDENVTADIFMSDDGPSFRNAWSKIMGPAKKFLLCTWHVKNAIWKNVHAMITKVKDKQFVFTCFKAICDEQEIDEFHTKLDAFLLWLNENEFEEFLKYFKKHYIERDDQEERVHLWAKCYRAGVMLNTNNHVENMHKLLKHDHLGGTTITRIDKVMYELGVMVKRKFRKSACDQVRGRTKLSKAFYKRCELSKNYLAITLPEDKYKVSSENSEPHEVTLLQFCVCINKCKRCDVCKHMYKCDCADFKNDFTCKHIHAVGYANKIELEQRFDNCVEDEDHILDYSPTLNEYIQEGQTKIRYDRPDDNEREKLFNGIQEMLNDLKILLQMNSNLELTTQNLRGLKHSLTKFKTLHSSLDVNSEKKLFFTSNLSAQSNQNDGKKQDQMIKLHNSADL